MLVQYEKRNYSGREKIWVGAYSNLHNLSHWHIDNEIIFVKSGEADVSVNGELFHLKEGDCVFCQSGNLHYIKGENDSLLNIFLYDNALTCEITENRSLEKPILENEYNVADVYAKIREEFKNQKAFYEVKTNAILTSLVADIFRNEKTSEGGANVDKTLLNYKNLLSKIDENFAYISFSEAASFMGLSETYFSKLFKSICGMTFSQYLNVVRIEKAVDMLNLSEKIPITEIATNCGYSSIRHFNRVFLETTGFSPKQMPKNFRPQNKPVKTFKDAFDPTLGESKLIL